ncbi:hypothetical protein SUGI_0995670 [Cryptomeria japonica]|uniref:zinc finger CCCH domain-containing protein 66 n=1 Tax=Cryptomeria japonica TaxID=3369 RepID=UPI002414C42E|nr:zinc finger CCCH domain-containing protein 66 [Cryptomeria japonica]GLJ47160.1 hypothetical protein SUGI_0995670 [Cryptomeria japonica]
MEYQGPNQRPNGNIGNLGMPNFKAFNWTPESAYNLNEAMQKMSIQPTDSGNGLEISSGPYPERPGVADCTFYIRTGSCKFGMNCHFNHPPNRKQASQTGDPPNKVGQTECQFYLKGTCKYGALCKYGHSNQKEGSGGEPKFNYLGLPIRQGEKECPFYMRTGSCKYAVTCKYHHPEPGSEATTSVSNSPTRDNLTSSETSYGSVNPSRPLPRAPYSPLPRAPYAPSIHPEEYGSYMHPMYPSQEVSSPVPGWSNNYQAPVSGFSSLEGKQRPIGILNMQRNGQSLSGTHVNDSRSLSSSAVRPFGLQSTRTDSHSDIFPERPSQQECQHFLKTGTCKFGAACKFHHPKRTELSGPKSLLPSSENKQHSIGIDFENNVKQLNDQATSTQGSVYSVSKPMPFASMVPAVQLQATIQNCRFPERPGQPECQYYLKTGDCRFGDGCLYHHPKERFEQSTESMLNPTSLPVNYVHASPFSLKEEMQDKSATNIANAMKHPNKQHIYYATMDGTVALDPEFAMQKEIYAERPGQPECQHYKKTGVCKFGAACRYHHPKEGSEKFSTR